MRRQRFIVLLCALLVAWNVVLPGSAAGFGTIDSGGQHREHEHITRAALACTGGARSELDCFEPKSLDYLAGHDREFGAVGSPDSDEMADPAAHCDNADYLAGSYPRTRDDATASLLSCVNHLRTQLQDGVRSAKDLLDDQGQVIADEVSLDPECKPRERAEHRAKCASIEGFGRVLHGVQDFYSHSNWADQADPARPLGVENPPGLHLSAPSPLLSLRGATAPSVPGNLTTGCYVLKDEVSGTGRCELRVTHAALNKDKGLIDPVTGRTSDPATPRGLVGDNFAKAVSGAIAESRRQWQDFQSELIATYGEDEGERMVCALTHDDPVNDCRDAGPSSALVAAQAAGVALAAVVTIMLLIRRRRTRRQPPPPASA